MMLRENIDNLMSEVTIGEEMRRAIMEGRRKRRFQGGRMAFFSAAAVLFAASTMYVGAGYLMEHMPVRSLFDRKKSPSYSFISVPEGMQRKDIYGEILDSGYLAGEKIIDNEMFSIELLETTCAGREITVSYILTKKAGKNIIVDVWLDTEFAGKVMDGSIGNDDSGELLTLNSFTDNYGSFPRKDSGYTLAMNQEMCVVTQLGSRDYESGDYMLYAMCHTRKTEDGTVVFERWADEEGKDVCSVPIEITGNNKYGLDLTGDIDMAEGDFRFASYGMYISPLTVYLDLYGVWQGSGDPGLSGNEYEMVIGFADGTEARTVMQERQIKRSSENKNITVNMKAAFDGVIDPDSIVKIELNEITIMGK